jgi:hypothetical protein
MIPWGFEGGTGQTPQESGKVRLLAGLGVVGGVEGQADKP